MTLLDIITKSRSIRRFDEGKRLDIETLKSLVNLARLAPSARNSQALKYKLLQTELACANMFPALAWAGYLTDWQGPVEGERPAAYIIVLKDTLINNNIFCDDGLAIQNILLGATEQGLGACVLASIKREYIRETFSISNHLEILYVIALGKPDEEVVLKEMDKNKFEYWRDDAGVHYVPKRNLDDLLID